MFPRINSERDELTFSASDKTHTPESPKWQLRWQGEKDNDLEQNRDLKE